MKVPPRKPNRPHPQASEWILRGLNTNGSKGHRKKND